MSSVQTVFFGEVPYYSNLQDCRFSKDQKQLPQHSYRESLKESRDQPKKQDSLDKKQQSDNSLLKVLQQQKKQQKIIKPQNCISQIHDALNRKILSSKKQITVYFFNSQKRIIFQKQEINKIFDNRENVTIKQLIPHIVSYYCRLFMNFQPYQVNQQSFQLKLADFSNAQDPLIEAYDPQTNICHLYEANNLVLIRKKRSYDRIQHWKKLINIEKTDMQVIEILIPFQRELIEKIQKTKSVNTLKEKILTYNQLGKIVMVYYTSFKLCQVKRVCELEQKICQIYREKVPNFQDKPTSKNLNSYNNATYYEQLWKIPVQKLTEGGIIEVNVCENYLFGKLTLILDQTRIIQKYTGGLMSYIEGKQRIKLMSVHTLVGIGSYKLSLRFKFVYKNRFQIKQYQFDECQKSQIEIFLKAILRLGRIYSKNFCKI